ncbi:hypothetical protein ACFYZT_04305 [Streptomyces sp. NPDC001591]|uniref:hypothetical protein n=1 Tax=Streptomyces sp. NPDC001591 TaxID=3364589 RepID=UPI00368DDFA6
MSLNWDQFHDIFQEKVAALIKAKKADETVEKAEPAADPTEAVALMEALRAGIERAGRPKDTGGKATTSRKATTSSKAAARTPPPKKRIPGGPELSKADLHKKAAAANVPGRSNMNRDDLLKALSRP